MSSIYFTICSCNYLAHALTLRQSFLEQHPGVDFRVVLLDEAVPEVVEKLADVTFVESRALGIPTFYDMAFRYNIVECNTAVKPAAILYFFLREGVDRVYYIDPDIYALQPWTHVAELFDHGASAVVTPHITSPLEDKLDPDDFRIMRTGIYNLGFIAFAKHPQSIAFIEWWGRKMIRDCRTDLPSGIFQDQKYVDLITCFVDKVAVLRHPGYNIAYWNLPHRTVAKRDDTWTANGQPIHFFHFSGVAPDNRAVFSKHQNRYPSTDHLGPLKDLVFEYVDKVESNDHAFFKRVPYAYGALTDGTPVTQDMRSIYAQAVTPERIERDEAFAPDFTLYNRRSNRVPAYAGLPFTTIMDQVWLSRGDLREAFDVTSESGQRHFLNWFVDTAAREHGVPEACIAPVRRAKASLEGQVATVNSAAPGFGATVFGFLGAESGVGEGGRRTLASLAAVGVPTAGRRLKAPTFRDTISIPGGFLRGRSPYRFHIFWINADNTTHLQSHVDIDDVVGRYRIGIWAWELPRFPEAWLPALDEIDEVWAISDFVAHAVRQVTRKPVCTMPLPVPLGVSFPALGRRELGLPENKLLVLIAFDFNSYIERKNPWGALEVFDRVVSRLPSAPLHLVVKVHGGGTNLEARRALGDAVAGRDNVTLIDRVMSREEIDALQASCDVYLSLHRSEGFGLNIAECMAHGKVVIATNYSGNKDFLDPSCGVCVGFGMRPLARGDYPYGDGQWWAEPDLDEAADGLARVVVDADLRKSLGRAASLRVAELLSYRKVGLRMKARLEAIATKDL